MKLSPIVVFLHLSPYTLLSQNIEIDFNDAAAQNITVTDSTTGSWSGDSPQLEMGFKYWLYCDKQVYGC